MSPCRKKLDHGLIHSLTLLIFFNINFNCNNNIGVQSLESGQRSPLLRPGVSSNSFSGIIDLLSGSGLSSGGSGQNKIHRPNVAQPRRDRDRERQQSQGQQRKNNEKSKNKNKSKTKIVTFSYSPGWRTECVYMCNRKPRGNRRFPKGRRDRPCPAEDARVVSIVNVKWCCKLDKTNALKVHSPSSSSGRRGGGARGGSGSGSSSSSGRGGFRSDILSLLSSPRCSEPFDSAEAESQVGGVHGSGSGGGSSSTTHIDPEMEADIIDTSVEDGNGATPTKPSNSQNQITFFSNSNFEEPSGSYNYGVRPNSIFPMMSG